MHCVHIHLGEQRGRSSNYQRNEDITSLMKLTYVTGPDEPCNVSGEVRPPKAVNDVCSCGKVSMMSSSIVSGSENCWPFVAVNDYFMMTLQILPPKTAILFEEAFHIMQECGICGIGQSQRMFSGVEPFANAPQMVVGMAGSMGLGE